MAEVEDRRRVRNITAANMAENDEERNRAIRERVCDTRGAWSSRVKRTLGQE